MGHPRKYHKSYSTPRHPWQTEKLTFESELIKTYGLRNKREVWTAENILRKYRRAARRLLAESAAKRELVGHAKNEADQIITRLHRFGVLQSGANLDDILILEIGNILERRLQTQVYRQGLAHSIRQARQFITHGHIGVSDRKTTIPGYTVSREEEMLIDYYTNSPLAQESHPERPTRVKVGESILDKGK
ncbi:MAG: 30S ribosomal protein S4, partial [Nitrospiraceae bacterium]|nr:30S ribosomal protein S4 [Nitrospiraceae bacterium]